VVTTYRGEGHHWPRRGGGAIAAKGSTALPSGGPAGAMTIELGLAGLVRAWHVISIDRRGIDPLAIDRDRASEEARCRAATNKNYHVSDATILALQTQRSAASATISSDPGDHVTAPRRVRENRRAR